MEESIKLSNSQRIILDITAVKENIVELKEKQDKHHKVLIEGNGELPLVEKVRNLEGFVNGQKFWLKTIMVAIVLQTITFSGAALIYFFKLYPLLENLQKIK